MLTVRTGYAILALACLHGREGQWVQVRDIADCTHTPKPYLHKILHALGRSGLIRSKRGYRGGISLSRPSAQITLMDVAEAVEGRNWTKRCLLGLEECSDERACPIHEFWSAQKKQIEAKLTQTTLADVAAQESKKEGRLENIADLNKYIPRPWP